jgi:RHS repeat-associated protein
LGLENHLSSVTLPGTGGTTTFRYDPLGRRIQKSAQNGTINYVYDGASAIEEVDASGSLLVRYAQGAGIDEPLAELRSGTGAFYETDGLGSVTSLTNSTGTISNSNTYDTFGNATVSGTFVNPYRYTARDYDPETGLQYSRARYYDPSTGRFLSEDPVGFDGGINFYPYVGNAPTNFTDPFGLQAQPVPVPIGPGPVLVPKPVQPAVSFCSRFPLLCAIVLPLFPMNGGDLGPTRCADEAGAPGCSGPYPSQVLNYHHNQAKQKCAGNNCKPCDPPVGTIAYRLDATGRAHRGVPTPHWHLYVMQQDPATCVCGWVDIKDNQGGFGPGTPPSGTVPIGPAAGGGHP